jgi:hypothetical protein
MSDKWERRRILIWGKTRPELSMSYKETVCTGGVFEDTKRLVRLYPIPLRYLDDERYFKKYQWIEAYVTKSTRDSRRESYKIRADEIEVFETIPPKNGDWDARAEWVFQPENVYESVEAIQDAQKRDNTSLGIIKPGSINDFQAELASEKDRAEFWQRYESVLQQMDLPFDVDPRPGVRPLSPPDYRFKIVFRCDDSRCTKDHEFSVLDWEIDALYFNLKKKGDTPHIASQKVITKLRDDVCSPAKDIHFFLGTMSNHPHVFSIVGLWYPKKKPETRQLNLFK